VVLPPPAPVVPVVLVLVVLDVPLVLVVAEVEELPPLEQPSSKVVKKNAPRLEHKKDCFIARLENSPARRCATPSIDSMNGGDPVFRAQGIPQP
ncbi:MAG: hypothetical protein ABI193_22490, partial [Minicystis sp.]